ncbi:MAG: ribonuclease HII [Bacteroidetes bacterium]|nr:ribonuclease HII [Bacteroidota bacterium]MDA0931657.1 ribonuclease HII [Bacteroidota bacterium]
MIYPGPDSALLAGCDEAGRGCLAGPVFAAAVILKPGHTLEGLNDSKQLSLADRNRLRIQIEEQALSWSVAQCTAAEVDEINVLNASILAMHRAIDGLQVRPDGLLIDGNRFKAYWGIPHRCEIKGDARFACIAAASILAKTYRDSFMLQAHHQFPQYGWDENKGYPTPFHKKALRQHGYSPIHRLSFRGVKN